MGDLYSSSRDHLRDELSWLDRVIDLARLRSRRNGGQAAGSGVADQQGQEGAIQDVEAERGRIVRKVADSLLQGVDLRLPQMVRRLRLSPFESDILVVALAPELDIEYERRYAELDGAGSSGAPTVDQCLRLLCRDEEEWMLGRAAFLPAGRLRRHAVLHLTPGAAPGSSALACRLRVDDGVIQFLLGSDALDPALASCSLLLPDPNPPSSGAPGREAADLLRGLRACLQGAGASSWAALFHGPDLRTQESTVRQICAALELPLLRVDLEHLVGPEEGLEPMLRLITREAVLRDAAIFLSHADRLEGLRMGQPGAGKTLEALLAETRIVFIGSRRPYVPVDGLRRRVLLRREFPVPSASERARLWKDALEGSFVESEELQLDDLAARFRLTSGEIHDAARAAQSRALARDGRAAAVAPEDLADACREVSNHGLRRYARKVTEHPSWDDVVLPPLQRRQLLEIVQYVRRREQVLGGWGFGSRHGLGRGVNVLFSGPPGTGKTMAAGAVAANLGLDLYRIDLATVVSKYIGEAEKNLGRIFDEAETSNAILLFDEADALFGRRTDVKDAHDRYANLEVDYLLQKMEEHEEIVILATNLGKNLDEALLRRLQFTVQFPFPDREERLRIWQKVFPQQVPVEPKLDWDFLARRLKVAGGSIKNMALCAAFLAREEEAPIRMRHLIVAAAREFQKQGKICTHADFGEYFDLVK